MLALLLAALAASASPLDFTSRDACSAASFNVSLQGVQCDGLTETSASDARSCVAVACAAGVAQWQLCPAGATCSGYRGPSCWVGSVPPSSCAPTTQGWGGGARTVPPPPPPLPQRFEVPPASSPLALLDLGDADGGAWTLSVDGAPARGIAVPGGGYSSDAQAQPWINSLNVARNATYARVLSVPASWPSTGAASRIRFGAVNHGALVFLNGALVGEHYGPMMPFDVALPALAPGSAHALVVVVLPYAALGAQVPSGFLYADAWTAPPSGFASRACAGICRGVALVALPTPLRVDALVTAARVAAATLSALVTVRNDGPSPLAAGAALVRGALGSARAGAAAWAYPPFPDTPLPALAPGAAATVAVTLGWPLGPASFWWPNRPYNASYAPQLHWLNVSLVAAAGGAPLGSGAARRFGFVEHTEGGAFFYTINGVRLNQLSDATPENAQSFYDAYSSSAAAWGADGGAADTFRRYMRLGITSNRIHQSTPTPAMLDAADEVGFLLKPESPVRGDCNYLPCSPSVPAFEQSVRELIAATRGHACVAAYSIENESGGGELLGGLVDAAADALGAAPVPLTTEGSGSAPHYNGSASGAHAVNYLHYAVPDHSRARIRAVGECAWCVADGLEQFSALALAGRLDDVAYYAGWDMLNYWPNFIADASAARHAWKQQPCSRADRVDGVDGWGSPVVDWVARAFHAFAVVDVGAATRNPSFTPDWPAAVDSVRVGALVTRDVRVFNDALADTFAPWSPAASDLTLAWTAAWDAPAGAVAASGSLQLTAAPGFSASANVSFIAPPPGAPTRKLFVVLESRARDGALRYTEDRVFVIVET